VATDLNGVVLDGRYRVLARVGEGAMGSVYRGEHVKLGRVVAIKVINASVPSAMASRERFEREAMAMAKLEHPHCATVFDVGVHDEMPYVVMDFVTGPNLKEVLAAGPLPTERAVEITRQVLAGLSCAHEHGIIHRDIKPANIVLSQKPGLGDHVKILDFGLAKFNAQTSNLTSGFVVGTPSYMAPEQILGRPVDQRTDLYACGVLLFELLTGTTPFQAANNEPVGICMMHLNVDPPRLRDKAPGSDFGALEEVVARALAKEPDQRFATATEFADALAKPRGRARTSPMDSDAATAATQHLDAALPRAPKAAPRRRGRMGVAVGTGGVLVAVAVASIWFFTHRASSEPAAVPQTTETKSIEIDPPPPIPVDAAQDPVSELIDRAGELSRGRAIDLLVKARKAYPSDARLPYRAGLLYMDEMWWADGLKQLRAAIALDPKLKSDPAIIKAVLRGFNTTASYDWTLAGFLHDDIGEPAKPYLEEVAREHPNPLVRKRAAAELRRY
jgi:serine/threonine-protein kinase